MATETQVELYKKLCEELGQDADSDFENLSDNDAGESISELIAIKEELDKAGIDDDFWY